MSPRRKGKLRIGDRRWFSPSNLGDPRTNCAAGQVEIIEIVDDLPEPGCAYLYRVRNTANGQEAHAFGDELS